jgi:hypothetical protein
VTGEFKETASLKTARSHFGTGVLPDGRVVVAGGVTEGGSAAQDTEIYDPATQSWSSVSGPASPSISCRMAALKDGRLLVVGGLAGGISKAVSLFDGTAWSKMPSTQLPRFSHAVAALPSGGALVIAGLVGNGLFSSTVERLPADLSAWTEAPPLTSGGDEIEKPGGTGISALTLPSGRVLVTGTYGPSGLGFGASRFASMYDEATDTWSAVEAPLFPRGVHATVRLQDGRVMLLGGIDGLNSASKTTERTAAPVE